MPHSIQNSREPVRESFFDPELSTYAQPSSTNAGPRSIQDSREPVRGSFFDPELSTFAQPSHPFDSGTIFPEPNPGAKGPKLETALLERSSFSDESKPVDVPTETFTASSIAIAHEEMTLPRAIPQSEGAREFQASIPDVSLSFKSIPTSREEIHADVLAKEYADRARENDETANSTETKQVFHRLSEVEELGTMVGPPQAPFNCLPSDKEPISRQEGLQTPAAASPAGSLSAASSIFSHRSTPMYRP